MSGGSRTNPSSEEAVESRDTPTIQPCVRSIPTPAIMMPIAIGAEQDLTGSKPSIRMATFCSLAFALATCGLGAKGNPQARVPGDVSRLKRNSAAGKALLALARHLSCGAAFGPADRQCFCPHRPRV